MTEDEMAGWHHRLDGHEFEMCTQPCDATWGGSQASFDLLGLSSVICEMGEQDGKEELTLAVTGLHSTMTQERGNLCAHGSHGSP